MDQTVELIVIFGIGWFLIMEAIWANTDFPYQCLKDEIRTNAFRKAIHKVVKHGDIVLVGLSIVFSPKDIMEKISSSKV